MGDEALNRIKSPPVIKAVNACVEFDNELALDDVTFSIEQGVLIGVVGPNGGGKTTLFNAIAGLQRLANGAIFIKGNVPEGRKRLGEVRVETEDRCPSFSRTKI